MKRDLMEILACPLCKGDLDLEVFEEKDGEILDGRLRCKGCGEVYPIEDDQEFVIDLLRAKKILVTHGTGFNWFEPDHFRLVTLPDVPMLTEAIGRIAEFLETKRAS